MKGVIRWVPALSLLVMLGLSAGCSLRQMMVSEAADFIEKGMVSFEQDDDLDLLEEAFPANIKLCEGMLANSPRNRQMLVALSRMYASYAFAFLEEDLELLALKASRTPEEQQQMAHLKYRVGRYYLKGAGYARRALLETDAGACMENSDTDALNTCFKKLDRRHVPELFWYAFNLGTYVNQNRDDPEAFSFSQRALQAMERVLELDPGYFHGGAYFFFMGYHASIPESLGGRPEMVPQYYRELKALKGEDFFLSDLYYARFYMVNQGDREGFEKLLNHVLDRSRNEDAYPLLNRVARRRAKIYLDRADFFFN